MILKERLTRIHRNWVWILASIAFWCLLWGAVDLQTILGGILAAGLVFVLFPMPPTGHELTIRPVQFVTFVARFLYDLAASAVQVGWYALRPAGQPPASVIAVQLASRSDLFLTGTGVLSTLIPGSVVVEAQRATGTLFLHVIGPGTEDEVEKARQSVLAQEKRLLLALARREVLEEAGLR